MIHYAVDYLLTQHHNRVTVLALAWRHGGKRHQTKKARSLIFNPVHGIFNLLYTSCMPTQKNTYGLNIAKQKDHVSGLGLSKLIKLTCMSKYATISPLLVAYFDRFSYLILS